MASILFLFCGPCESKKSHRQATVWCSVCMEGLCRECEELHASSKLSKDHSTFDENDFPLMRPFMKDLKMECDIHEKRLDFYCQNHLTLCCVSCVTDTHRQCNDVTPVDEKSRSSKSFLSFSNLEHEFETILQKIEDVKSKRTLNIKYLNKQRTNIQAEIKEARKLINDHLDKLENNVLTDLDTTEEKITLDIAQTLFEIDTKKQVILDLQTIMGCIKRLSSETQILLAMQKVDELFSSEQQLVESILQQAGREESHISFQLCDKIKYLPSNIEAFGNVKTLDKQEPHKLEIVEEKRISTMIPPVRHSDSFEPNRVHLKLLKKIKTCKRKSKMPSDIRGCAILSNNKLLCLDWSDNKKLIIYNADGSHCRDVGLNGKPYDVARLEGDRVAVSFPEDNTVQLFDVVTNGYPIFQTLKLADQCWGIFYSNGKLFVGCNGHKIQIMNLSGTVEKTIPAYVNTVYCVNVDSNQVYYCDEINNTVYCCDFEGNTVWKFKEPSLKYPCSIACHSDGYVFVAGNISQNLLITSSDGQQSSVLLRSSDGLDGPAGIHYDVYSKRLLIVLASFKGVVALYDVVTKPTITKM